jgi:UDP-N-acetylglucosamine 2-epimerase (non-hydrolysing)
MKVATIFGTRPEIIRLSLIFPLLDNYFEHVMINTQQNFTNTLNKIFFKQLKIREPDYNLNVDTSNIGTQLSDTIRKTFDVLRKERPDWLLVLGDTYSGLSAIPASNLQIKIAHMEAGMRCYDWRVPEERNRTVIDHLATINLPYTNYSRENLIRENIHPSKIFVIGNPIVEILNQFKKEINSSTILKRLNLKPNGYILVTAHRSENVDNKETLASLMESLSLLKKVFDKRIIFPVHPRTLNKIINKPKGVEMFSPVGLFDFTKLEQNAFCVISDSGTVPEECLFYNKPCVTIRKATERTEYVEAGSSMLSEIQPDQLVDAVNIMTTSKTNYSWDERLGDGKTSRKVIQILQGENQ